MNAEENDYMERYIYQVIKRLPKEQRDEVHMELEELISDMYSDKGSMEEVLTELGDPAAFAHQYQTGLHHLIGPDYYDNFIWAVKTCLTIVAAMTFFVSIYSVFSKNPASQYTAGIIISKVMEGISKGIEEAVMGCISAFGVITLLFAVMEREKVRLDERNKQWSVGELKKGAKAAAIRWNPELLDPIPDKRAIISKSDSIFGIVVLTILCVLTIFAPELFAAVVTDNGEWIASVSFFNLDKWNAIMPLIAVSLIISLADEILRLIVGRYCRPVMISCIASSVITIVLDIIVLKVLPIWNPNFGEEIVEALNQAGTTDDMSFFLSWSSDMTSNILLAIIILFTLIELGVTIYKTLRYDVKTAH
jgi:hypothetical protein